MSELTAILLLLATLLWATFCVYFALREIHRRCDDVATGVVNGHPVSLRYRWLMRSRHLTFRNRLGRPSRLCTS
jgi:hypothetical protein